MIFLGKNLVLVGREFCCRKSNETRKSILLVGRLRQRLQSNESQLSEVKNRTVIVQRVTPAHWQPLVRLKRENKFQNKKYQIKTFIKNCQAEGKKSN